MFWDFGVFRVFFVVFVALGVWSLRVVCGVLVVFGLLFLVFGWFVFCFVWGVCCFLLRGLFVVVVLARVWGFSMFVWVCAIRFVLVFCFACVGCCALCACV